MCCFIHYTDIALRTRTKFYKILDVLEKIIPCYMNVHILIMEVNEWGIILDVFFFLDRVWIHIFLYQEYTYLNNSISCSSRCILPPLNLWIYRWHVLHFSCCNWCIMYSHTTVPNMISNKYFACVMKLTFA
jgi:hypothetical protein